MPEPQSANMTINAAVTLVTIIITIPFNEKPYLARAVTGSGENPDGDWTARPQKPLTKTPQSNFDFEPEMGRRRATQAPRSFRKKSAVERSGNIKPTPNMKNSKQTLWQPSYDKTDGINQPLSETAVPQA